MKIFEINTDARFLFVFLFLLNCLSAAEQEATVPLEPSTATSESSTEKKSAEASQETKKNTIDQAISDICINHLKAFPGNSNSKFLTEACKKTVVLSDCRSVSSVPIYHYERTGKDKSPKRILAFSMIHGDETHAGTVGRYWMERLEEIEPRNHWRVVPVLNPDGVKEKTRYNANKIDLNRNFPTKDWDELAQKYWRLHTQSSPRRFPGSQSGSEPETKCALQQIEDFKPDFVISIHTPLNVLDFDGPKVPAPKYNYLPWKSLGHFPGSLGRYMWFERNVPVLTMELKPSLPKSNDPFETLQDLIGTLVKYDMK
jgi:murein peptide amidase A